MPRITSEPTIQPLSDEPAVQGYLERFSAAIAERPDSFAKALKNLGEAATAETVELSQEEHDTSHFAVSDEELITSYFKHRYDRYVEYDKATEKAMDKDTSYQAALAGHLEAHSTKVMLGKMTSTTRSSSNAESTRNAARRASLAFFIHRLGLWQVQQERKQQLPSAG